MGWVSGSVTHPASGPSDAVDGHRRTMTVEGVRCEWPAKTVPKGEAVRVLGWSFGEQSGWMRSGAHEARRSDAAPVRGKATQKIREAPRAKDHVRTHGNGLMKRAMIHAAIVCIQK
jgi:hypothetical protein